MNARAARPIVGITADADASAGTYASAKPYAAAVARAGGLPIILPHRLELLDDYLHLCDAFVFSGGDDPRMEEFGAPTHPKAKPLDPDRQAFEVALLRRLHDDAACRDAPALGVCLGMQLMSLVAGGSLNQHLPDDVPTHADHWGRRLHPVETPWGSGEVSSHHRQAVAGAGSLQIVARAPDGVIEAVRDPRRRFHVGVQWHPERTADPNLGARLFEELIAACR